MRTLQRIKNFARIKKSWFGEGGIPVATELAQQRANVCLKCPMNDKGEWWWNIATQIYIASQSELRRIMNLKVEGGDNLHTCEACGCPIKNKIFVPLRHIIKHTSTEQLDKFHESCWIRNEKPQ